MLGVAGADKAVHVMHSALPRPVQLPSPPVSNVPARVLPLIVLAQLLDTPWSRTSWSMAA